jgi:dihydropteroate synthase type 2
MSFGGVGIVGVVNITEDSFSDGGLYLKPEAAIANARHLYASGADIIELGPASSHPDAKPVTAAEEQRRLAPVLDHLATAGVPVSVDSFLVETQRFALTWGVAWLNDIHGFPHPELHDELASASCRLVVVHSVQEQGKATRLQTDPATIWDRIDAFFATRLAVLERAGIARERMLLDPGLGFFLGANSEPSLAVLSNIGRLRARFGLPVLVSPSRKSFLRTLTGRTVAEIGPATLAVEIYAALNGVDYIRTHDVQALGDSSSSTLLRRQRDYGVPGPSGRDQEAFAICATR